MTPKQQMFCKEYLIDLNATQAAIRAGYSKNTAIAQASRLLVNVNIQTEIQKAMAARAKKVELTAEKVLRDITLIKADAMSFGDSGKMTDRQAALRACELEGKHLKMFTDKIDMAHVGIINFITSIPEPDLPPGIER